MNDFDWVTARSQCSLAAIFERLKLQLQDDVGKRQGFRKGPPFDIGFRMIVENASVSIVAEGIPGVSDAVYFCQTAQGIEIRDKNHKTRFVATPTINDDGECRLKVNGEEKDLWHVRKMALEDLFFASLDERLSRAT